MLILRQCKVSYEKIDYEKHYEIEVKKNIEKLKIYESRHDKNTSTAKILTILINALSSGHLQRRQMHLTKYLSIRFKSIKQK